jgi:phospholipase C
MDDDNPYVPRNSPALSDLFDVFSFNGDGNSDSQGNQDGMN